MVTLWKEGVKVKNNIYQKCMGLILFITLIMATSVVFQTNIPPGFVGYRFFRVSGISMEPTLLNGSILLVKQKDPELIKKNDIITYRCYRGPKSCTTHRVVGILELKKGELQFITKGDGNLVKDPIPVPAKQVVGVVKYVFTPSIVDIFIEVKRVLIIVGLILLIAYLRWIDRREYTKRLN